EQHGWQVRLLDGPKASKDAVARVQAPRLLQFATHGYVLDADQNEAEQNPLLRSVLILAGANRRTTSKERGLYRVEQKVLNEDEARRKLNEAELAAARLEVGDGVLTALEAARLNLFGTELVSLTACETGLGAVTPDGIAGLRQAFLAAGARSLTMSM